MSETENTNPELPKSVNRRPENERQVWVEKYPGGDMKVEVGSMEHTEELYLQGNEARALREILNELPESGESDE